MALIVLPLWNFVGQKYGKKMSYYIGGSILCVSLASLYFVEEEVRKMAAILIRPSNSNASFHWPCFCFRSHSLRRRIPP